MDHTIFNREFTDITNNENLNGSIFLGLNYAMGDITTRTLTKLNIKVVPGLPIIYAFYKPDNNLSIIAI